MHFDKFAIYRFRNYAFCCVEIRIFFVVSSSFTLHLKRWLSCHLRDFSYLLYDHMVFKMKIYWDRSVDLVLTVLHSHIFNSISWARPNEFPVLAINPSENFFFCNLFKMKYKKVAWVLTTMWVRINFCRKPLQADYRDSQLDGLAFLCRILCLQMCACLSQLKAHMDK